MLILSASKPQSPSHSISLAVEVYDSSYRFPVRGSISKQLVLYFFSFHNLHFLLITHGFGIFLEQKEILPSLKFVVFFISFCSLETLEDKTTQTRSSEEIYLFF